MTIAFWAAYEQKGTSLNFAINDMVDRKIGDFEVPAAWFQALPALYVILLSPVFAAMWLRLGNRQPSSIVKFILALIFVGGGYSVFALVCAFAVNDKISSYWIALLFLFEVFGELCISPVGLSTITQLAPVRLVGIMMGLWFFATSFGYKLAGTFARFYAPNAAALAKLSGGIALGLFGVAVSLILLLPLLRRLIAGDTRG